MAFPVADLAAFLTGSWRIFRRIDDRLCGTTGRLSGAATFVSAPVGLLYEERGRLALGAYRGEADRSYTFVLTGPWTAEVRFADGRLFHLLDLSNGFAAVSHDCVPDRYDGLYRVDTPDRWTQAWCINGPRKQARLVTVYSRASRQMNV